MQRTFRQITNGLGLLALLGAPAACSDGTTVLTTVVHPTLVSVSPSDFLGVVPCVDAPGAMQSYVATVWDMGADRYDADGELVFSAGSVDPAGPASGDADPRNDWFPLPSSGPIPCRQSVGFARVIPGHHYYAEIRGYDRPNLVQLLPSVDVLFDADTGERVAPRWSTQCRRALRPSNEPPVTDGAEGDGAAETPISSVDNEFGVTALASFVRTIQGCDALVDADPSELKSVRISLAGSLGDVTCGTTEDAIERFEVRTPSGETLEAACGETITLEDVGAGTLVLPVLAYAAGADEPSFGTTCTATSISGLAVNASCQPLTDRGAVSVSPAAGLAALGLECQDVTSITLSKLEPNPEAPESDVVTDVRRLSAADCARSVSFSGLFRGTTAKVAVDAIGLDGAPSGTALCTEQVVPSQTVLAVCTLPP